MNKKVFGKKFSRDTTSRRAMYRALVRSFVINREIVTTHAKAKVVAPIVEKLFIQSCRGTLSDKRAIYKFCGNDRRVSQMIFELAKKLDKKSHKHLKIISLPSRKGDNAPMAKVELFRKIEVEKVAKPDVDEKAVGKKKSQKAQKSTETTEKKSSVSSVIEKLSLKKKVKK